MYQYHKFCECGRILTLEEMHQGDKCQQCKAALEPNAK